jgi:hypothetical protein
MLFRGLDDPVDEIGGDERARRIVDQHNLAVYEFAQSDVAAFLTRIATMDNLVGVDRGESELLVVVAHDNDFRNFGMASERVVRPPPNGFTAKPGTDLVAPKSRALSSRQEHNPDPHV